MWGVGAIDIRFARMLSSVAALALAALSSAMVGQPASAATCPAPAKGDYFAFGCTGVPQDFATLTLQAGGKTVTLSDGGFQGWISNSSFAITGPNGDNTDYIAGLYNGAHYNNFFVFNLGGVHATVTSAKLNVYSGKITEKLEYSLFGATQAITQLASGISPNADLYAELGSGMKYGNYRIGAGNSFSNLVLTLNAAAVSGINAEIQGKASARFFALSGTDAPAPEPATWAMMLIGFAGLGLAAFRKARMRLAHSPQ